MEVGKCWKRLETHRKSLRPYIKMLVSSKDKKKKRRTEKIPSKKFADIRLGYSLGIPSTNLFLRRHKESGGRERASGNWSRDAPLISETAKFNLYGESAMSCDKRKCDFSL